MFIVNGVAYAGTPETYAEEITVTSVKPLKDYKLLLRFSTGEKKEYDVRPLLKIPLYEPLKDKALFNKVRARYGAPVWNNGKIDIAPETLYEDGVLIA